MQQQMVVVAFAACNKNLLYSMQLKATAAALNIKAASGGTRCAGKQSCCSAVLQGHAQSH
jgi:hypothetical protein